MVQSRHKPPQHEPGEASHRKTRIENPTCETCRWFVNRPENKYLGKCALNPPVIFQVGTRCDYEPQHPMVSNGEFCSHHESAFIEPEDEKYPLLRLKFFRDISNENRIFIFNKFDSKYIPMVTTNEQVQIFNKLIENGKGEDLWMWFGKIQTMGGH